MKQLYFGNHDVLDVKPNLLPTVVIDGRQDIARIAHLEHVMQWLQGTVNIQLVYGEDRPNVPGMYICTDSAGNVRYGEVQDTAANCFRFVERYENTGYTAWYDKQSADEDCIVASDLDMSELSNWMLLMPTRSRNQADVTKFPAEYRAVKDATEVSVTAKPCDLRDAQTLGRTEKINESVRQYYLWQRNLRGESRVTFATALAAYVSGIEGDWETDELYDLTLESWKEYARYLKPDGFQRELATDNIFVIARTCYYHVVKRTPKTNRYYDTVLSQVEEHA
ncbi:hypothetical protein YOLOSWAG_261 [Erwinia phage vB_EamM_Yoloswag]|uniref:Uncharacterized protein n=1 Tax=Erwinia phage vB_EamM_Yoloswag TaxID=1958956 RepID=A0A1S6L3H4_9CAUD|nr:hypothetical protein HOR66_gp261 [Erwinia phage vB_EamM_Yoloswag]AQT28734.1 hypothetical protein YOLOSWAG_261 [Erwinia phage vB_EamM_Yoloswag]